MVPGLALKAYIIGGSPSVDLVAVTVVVADAVPKLLMAVSV